MQKMRFVLVLMGISLTTCVIDRDEYAIGLQTKLFESIKDFEFQLFETRKMFQLGIDQTLTRLKEDSVYFKTIAFEWKATISKVEYEYELINQDLGQLQKDASKYFEKLKQIADSINTKELRERELRSINSFRKQWSKMMNQGKEAMGDFSRLIRKAKDMQKLLITGGIRYEPQNSIDAFEAYKLDYHRVIQRLTNLAKYTKLLIADKQPKIPEKI